MNVTATGIAVALAIVVALGLLVFGPGMFSPAASTATSQDILLPNTMTEPENQGAPLPETLPTELTATDEMAGTGTEAAPGDTVSVRYTGVLPDGTVFDASVRHGNEPFTFTLGGGQVIRGWDEGLVGMKEGGKRRLIIPPLYGYGSQDLGVIPPNSTLIFDVELLSVTKGQ